MYHLIECFYFLGGFLFSSGFGFWWVLFSVDVVFFGGCLFLLMLFYWLLVYLFFWVFLVSYVLGVLIFWRSNFLRFLKF